MKKVILLEDDADLTEIIEIIITSEHYDLLTLSNAGNIIKQITDFAPDVVILDVLSSGADGRLICRELKSNEQLKAHTGYVVFSASQPGAASKRLRCRCFS